MFLVLATLLLAFAAPPARGDGLPAPDAYTPAFADAVAAYAEHKPLTASFALVRMRTEEAAAPSDVDYLLARCLYDMAMYGAAEALFLSVVDRGPDDPWYGPSLRYALRTTTFHGETSALAERVRAAPDDALDRGAQAGLAWVRARAHFASGEHDEALRWASRVEDGSAFVRPARQLAGVLRAERGEHAAAIRAFAGVLRSVDEAHGVRMERRNARALDTSRNHALLGIAATWYAAGRYEEARAWADRVPRGRAYARAQLMAAWCDFLLAPDFVSRVPGDRAGADDGHREIEARLRALDRAGAPPSVRWELTWLAALPGLVPCDPSTPAVARAEALRAELAAAKADPGPLLAAETADDPVVAAIATRRRILARERLLIDAQKAAWRDPVGAFAHTLLDTEEARLARVELERRAALAAGWEARRAELAHQVEVGLHELSGTTCNWGPGGSP